MIKLSDIANEVLKELEQVKAPGLKLPIVTKKLDPHGLDHHSTQKMTTEDDESEKSNVNVQPTAKKGDNWGKYTGKTTGVGQTSQGAGGSKGASGWGANKGRGGGRLGFTVNGNFQGDSDMSDLAGSGKEPSASNITI